LTRTAVALLVVAGVARSEVRQHDWKDHLHFWARTVQDAPLSYKAHHAYGQLLYAQGDSGSALREYETAIRLAPGEYRIQSELGDALRITGDCAAALSWYAKSLEIEPNQGSVRLSRIQCLMQLGRLDEARREAERTVPSTVRE
jgi:Flp pilus assembly protein TadD